MHPKSKIVVPGLEGRVLPYSARGCRHLPAKWPERKCVPIGLSAAAERRRHAAQRRGECVAEEAREEDGPRPDHVDQGGRREGIDVSLRAQVVRDPNEEEVVPSQRVPRRLTWGEVSSGAQLSSLA